MNGIHDIGGFQGLGAIDYVADEPIFDEDWERQVFALHVAMSGQGIYNIDQFRHGIERMHPIHYLGSPYYEHWLATIEDNLVRSGTLTRSELNEMVQRFESDPDLGLSSSDDSGLAQSLADLIPRGGWTDEAISEQPLFKLDDRVKTRNFHPTGHTRLPRYARAKSGVIKAIYPSLVLPDTNADNQGTNPAYVYNVEFSGPELWGDSAESNTLVRLDLWQGYLMLDA